MTQTPTLRQPSTLRQLLQIPVIVAALGYFVDIYDLLLFSIVRVQSLKSLGVPEADLLSDGVYLINMQMGGLLLGGILWGILGDKRGRISVLFGSILIYSLANLANGLVTSVDQYALLRFIAGVGLAGELGVGITLVWSGVGSAIIYKLVDVLVGLRVPVDAEREGLDISSHGERAYN